jgi:alkylation response protein AidB-like acyl-CoA dehydrogenase
MPAAPDLHVLDGFEPPLTFEQIRAAGYLLAAVPVELGGLGGTLRQVCDQQRRLARRAPELARATSAHHAWCGAAAEDWRAGRGTLRWVLDAAVSGQLVAPVRAERNALQEAWYEAVSSSVELGVGDRPAS